MPIISYLTTIRFDFGAIQGVQQDLTELGIRKPLIIADEGVAKAGIVGKITAVISEGAGLPVFTRTPTNPTEEAVEDALAIYREQGCDGLIAVGGGSPIDLPRASPCWRPMKARLNATPPFWAAYPGSHPPSHPSSPSRRRPEREARSAGPP